MPIKNRDDLIRRLRELADVCGYFAVRDALDYIRRDGVTGEPDMKKVQHIYDPDTGEWLGAVAPVREYYRDGTSTTRHIGVHDRIGEPTQKNGE